MAIKDDSDAPSKVALAATVSPDDHGDRKKGNTGGCNGSSNASPKKNKSRRQFAKSKNNNRKKPSSMITTPTDLLNGDDDGDNIFGKELQHHLMYAAAAFHQRTSFASSMYSCCGLTFQIHSLYQSDGDLAVVYTVGLQGCGLHFEGGFPELVLWDVPASKVEQVCRVFQFLAHQLEDHRLVKGGEIVESDNLVLETKWIACTAMRARLVDRFPFLSGMHNPSCKWLLLQPQFPLDQDHEYPRPYPMAWGSRPMAPAGETILRDRIVEILMQQVMVREALSKERKGGKSTDSHRSKVLWHVDGNPQNHSIANLQQVTLLEAFSNPTWYIDWRPIVDGDEAMVSFLKANASHFALIFRTRNDKVMTVLDENRIHFQYYPPRTAPTDYTKCSPYSPVADDSSMSVSYHLEHGSGHSSNTPTHKRGFLNIESPNFHPGGATGSGHPYGLSLPQTPPFGF